MFFPISPDQAWPSLLEADVHTPEVVPPTRNSHQAAKDTLEMVADGAPRRYRCELCAENGRMMAFGTQEELVAHYRRIHGK